MKNIIAHLTIAIVLFGGSAIVASAQIPTAFAIGSFLGTAAAANSENMFRVNAYDTRYHYYNLNRGETVKVQLTGDGDTDLDLYVYDENGKLISKSETYSDREYAYITANMRTSITVKVVNRDDVYNDYDLTVWIK